MSKFSPIERMDNGIAMLRTPVKVEDVAEYPKHFSRLYVYSESMGIADLPV